MTENEDNIFGVDLTQTEEKHIPIKILGKEIGQYYGGFDEYGENGIMYMQVNLNDIGMKFLGITGPVSWGYITMEFSSGLFIGGHPQVEKSQDEVIFTINIGALI